MRVNGSITGMDRLQSSLRMMAATLKGADAGASREAKDLLAQVAPIDAKQNDQAFSSQGVKSGQKWGALTPNYARRKKAAIGSQKILTYGGQLRDSLRFLNRPEHIARARAGKLELGTSHHLAQYHQTGTDKMKARPPVRKSAAQVEQLKIALAKGVAVSLSRIPHRAIRRAAQEIANRLHPKAKA